MLSVYVCVCVCARVHTGAHACPFKEKALMWHISLKFMSIWRINSHSQPTSGMGCRIPYINLKLLYLC